jgi:hypothetical protein
MPRCVVIYCEHCSNAQQHKEDIKQEGQYSYRHRSNEVNSHLTKLSEWPERVDIEQLSLAGTRTVRQNRAVYEKCGQLRCDRKAIPSRLLSKKHAAISTPPTDAASAVHEITSRDIWAHSRAMAGQPSGATKARRRKESVKTELAVKGRRSAGSGGVEWNAI